MLDLGSKFGNKERALVTLGVSSLKWAAIGVLSASLAACTTFGDKKKEEAPAVEVKEDPTDPAPWLKKAQESFAQGNYAETIHNANEVIARQSSNVEAKSMLVVSGLRIASRSLADLRSEQQVTGDARTEATEMVKTLREVLGENVLVPPAEPEKTTKKKPVLKKKPVVDASTTGSTSTPAAAPAAPAVKPAPAPAAKPKGNSDPFGALR